MTHEKRLIRTADAELYSHASNRWPGNRNHNEICQPVLTGVRKVHRPDAERSAGILTPSSTVPADRGQ